MLKKNEMRNETVPSFVTNQHYGHFQQCETSHLQQDQHYQYI